MKLTPRQAIYIITILHIVGLFGLNSSFKEYFALLTPINLLAGTILFLGTAEGLEAKNIWVLATIAVVGFFVEVIGVNTGFPFGNYVYGSVLGIKAINTPLMIGVNWLMLVVPAMLIGRLVISKNRAGWKVALIAALAMVLLDFLIEPVAIKTGMWHWYGRAVPVANYVSWFVVAFFLAWLAHYFLPRLQHSAAVGFFTIQIGFFLVMILV